MIRHFCEGAALSFENRNIPFICDLCSLRRVVAKALVSASKIRKFAVKKPGATLFILLGKLSFVYESKEKMRHKQYKCCRKTLMMSINFMIFYQ
ncbi:hypothetical protein [Rhizobium leguminosarum]|uniref:hypothetical protein n=1 Tax=Rhizobium leguminosarum TaxID=384 RepID=UPI001FF07007|nr:hypothetical protein [Rhizobium leguminosarum]